MKTSGSERAIWAEDQRKFALGGEPTAIMRLCDDLDAVLLLSKHMAGALSALIASFEACGFEEIMVPSGGCPVLVGDLRQLVARHSGL